MGKIFTRFLLAGALVGSILNWPLIARAEGSAEAPSAGAAAKAMFGRAPVASGALATYRGGADVASENTLIGTLRDNQASHLSTGDNIISSGSFAGAAGIPVVIQNSGNNVLIQNATIVNMNIQ